MILGGANRSISEDNSLINIFGYPLSETLSAAKSN